MNYSTFKTSKVLTLLFTIFLFSCDSDDSSSTCSNGVMDGTETGVDCGGDCAPCSSTVLIDGDAKTVSSITATLQTANGVGPNGPYTGSVMSVLISISSTETITLSYSTEDANSSCIPTGAYSLNPDVEWSSAGTLRFGAVNYTNSINTYGSIFLDDNPGSIDLVLCDASNTLASFSFDTDVYSPDGSSFINVSGSLSNISYIDNR